MGWQRRLPRSRPLRSKSNYPPFPCRRSWVCEVNPLQMRKRSFSSMRGLSTEQPIGAEGEYDQEQNIKGYVLEGCRAEIARKLLYYAADQSAEKGAPYAAK